MDLAVTARQPQVREQVHVLAAPFAAHVLHHVLRWLFLPWNQGRYLANLTSAGELWVLLGRQLQDHLWLKRMIIRQYASAEVEICRLVVHQLRCERVRELWQVTLPPRATNVHGLRYDTVECQLCMAFLMSVVSAHVRCFEQKDAMSFSDAIRRYRANQHTPGYSRMQPRD